MPALSWGPEPEQGLGQQQQAEQAQPKARGLQQGCSGQRTAPSAPGLLGTQRRKPARWRPMGRGACASGGDAGAAPRCTAERRGAQGAVRPLAGLSREGTAS